MDHFKKILLTTDLSTNAEAAAPYAIALAKAFHAEICLLHVFIETMYMQLPGDGTPPNWQDWVAASRRADQEKLSSQKEAIRQLGAERVSSMLLDGIDPPQTIIDFAKAIGADCIVTATHGRTGISRLMFGSVAEQVLRMAPCPVFSVKPSTPATAAAGFKTIVLPTDLSSNALAAAPYAIGLAKRSGASIHLVHVFEDQMYCIEGKPSTDAHDIPAVDTSHLPREQALRALANALGLGEDVQAVHLMHREAPAESIVTFAKAKSADCIIMSTHGRTGFSRLFFGSNAEHILRHSPCACMTVRPGMQSHLLETEDEKVLAMSD